MATDKEDTNMTNSNNKIDPFYDFVPVDHRLVSNHEGWGLVTGIVSLAGGEVRVSSVETRIDGSHFVTLTTPYAINVFKVMLPWTGSETSQPNDRHYRVYRIGNNFTGKEFDELSSSKNWKYLLKTLAKDRTNAAAPLRQRKKGVHTIGASIGQFILRIRSWHLEMVMAQAHRLVDACYKGKIMMANPMSHELQKYMLDVYYAESRHAVPMSNEITKELHEVTTSHRLVEQTREKLAEAVEIAIGFPKFVVITHPSGFVSVGKIDLSEIAALTKSSRSGPNVTKYKNQLNVLREFKLYESLDTVDDEIKADLMARLTMDKAMIKQDTGNARTAYFADDPYYANNNSPLYVKLDPFNLIPFGDCTKPEIGYVAFSSLYRDSSAMYVMLDA